MLASTDEAFRASLRRAADVEGPHRQLCSGFTDRLRGHNTDSFADIHGRSACQITAIAFCANTVVVAFAGQNRANQHFINAGCFNC
jgi:hypothetical protein